jgi:hypothetical protein
MLLLLLLLGLHSVCGQLQDPGLWTFVKGSQNQFNTPGVWGTRGVSSINNQPPALVGSCADRDQNAQNVVYLFGGQSSLSSYYSATWKLNISSAAKTVVWTWVAGPSTLDMVSNTSASGGYPSSRTQCSMIMMSVILNSGTWSSSPGSSYFFLFGGFGVVSSSMNGMLFILRFADALLIFQDL